MLGVPSRRSREFGEGIIGQQLTSAPEPTSVGVVPGPVEPVEPVGVDGRTFADIENGDPDSLFEEVVPDTAII